MLPRISESSETYFLKVREIGEHWSRSRVPSPGQNGTIRLPSLAMPPSPHASAHLPLAFLLSWSSSHPISLANGPRALWPGAFTEAPFVPGLWPHGTDSCQPIRCQEKAMLRGGGQRLTSNCRSCVGQQANGRGSTASLIAEGSGGCTGERQGRCGISDCRWVHKQIAGPVWFL